MSTPITFAVEFATDAAKTALGSLVNTVKASTVDIAQNILAPVSPANLVTQIAQQGLGINALGNTAVNAGIGMLANSRFGFLADAGAKFTAENSALNQTIADMRQNAQLGLGTGDDAIRFAYQTNLASAKAAESMELHIKRTLGVEIASNDAKRVKDLASQVWRDPEVQGAYGSVRNYADHYLGLASDAVSMSGSIASWGLRLNPYTLGYNISSSLLR